MFPLMDAPRTRYRVLEKDRRLIVIDTASGEAVSHPGPRPAAGSMEALGPLDRAALFLAGLAIKRRDAQGRAVVSWSGTVNNKPRKWEAWLDQAQERRFGRALLGVVPFPALILLLILLPFGAALWGILMVPAVIVMLASILSLGALMRETRGQTPGS
jgi:hypothetical protein